MRMKGIPVFRSRYWATSRTSPMVACERSATRDATRASSTKASLNTFIACVECFEVVFHHFFTLAAEYGTDGRAEVVR